MRHRAILLGALWALVCCFLLLGPLADHAAVRTVWAQEPDAGAQEAPEAPDTQEAPAGEDPAGQAPATAAAPPPAGGDTSDGAPETKTWLKYGWDALGPFYLLVFVGLSFTGVSLFVMNLLTARRENVCPSALAEAFEARLNEKQFQDAYELAKSDESFLGQVLSAGMAKMSSSGYEKAVVAMQEIGEEENMKLEHRLSYLALIGTISPMVGLFGTVNGMIDSFSVIERSAQTPKATELAGGISRALLTTLVGLAIAIPAIVAYNILKNRVARLVLEVGIMSEGLMDRFDNTKK